MNKSSVLSLSLKLAILFVIITAVIAMNNCGDPIETTYNITFRGNIKTKEKGEEKPLPFVRIYIEKNEPADNYAENAKNRKLGADANSAMDGSFKIVYPVVMPNDSAIAKAQAEGSEIKTTVDFWLVYVRYKKNAAGKTIATLYKQHVQQEVIIVPGAKTQKSYSLGEKIF
jgi:hypothetical protein